MSIAEKLTTIAENQQKVYAAGQQAGYDRFWDVFQENGNRTNYADAFTAYWPEELKPKYDMKPTLADGMFQKSKIIDLEAWLGNAVLDMSDCTSTYRMFSRSDVQVHPVMDLRKVTNLAEMYSYGNIIIIRKIILNDSGTQNTSTMFHGITKLEEVRFEGIIGYSINVPLCNKLSIESVQSIIDHLKDLTGATAQTLTLHKDVGGKLSDVQKAAITAKNWTLVY